MLLDHCKFIGVASVPHTHCVAGRYWGWRHSGSDMGDQASVLESSSPGSGVTSYALKGQRGPQRSFLDIQLCVIFLWVLPTINVLVSGNQQQTCLSTDRCWHWQVTGSRDCNSHLHFHAFIYIIFLKLEFCYVCCWNTILSWSKCSTLQFEKIVLTSEYVFA